MKNRISVMIAAALLILALTPAASEQVFADASEFYVPITVSGFNKDVIFDHEKSRDGAINLDSGVSCYYAKDGEEGSLPLNGVIGTDTGKYFKLADYNTYNALKLNLKYNRGKISFSDDSKGKYSKIALLATGGNGGGIVTATVKFEADGETEPVTQNAQLSVPDWSGGSGALKVYDCGRCRYGDGEITSKTGFGLYECVIDIDEQYRGYDITDIDLSATVSSDSTICIFAVSGVSAETGYKTVIFDAGRGASSRTVDKVESGTSITLPSASLKYHEFEGWYDGEEKVGDAEETYPVSSDTVLHAQWKETGAYILCNLGYSGETVKLFRQTDNTFEHPKRTDYIFSGFAEEPGGEAINESELVPGKTYYALWRMTDPIIVQGVEVTERNCADVLKDGGSVKYDIEKNELTLDSATLEPRSIANITGWDECAAIYREGPLKLKLIGTNTINCGNADGIYVNGIYIDGDRLDITGTGSLTVNASTAASKRAIYGIYAGSAVIDSNLYIESVSPNTYGVYGLLSEKDLIIDAPVDIKVEADEYSYGLDQEAFSGSTVINKNVRVEAESHQFTATGIYSGSRYPEFNADAEINVSSDYEARGIYFDRSSADEPNEIVFNNSGVVINAETEGTEAAYGIYNADKMHIKGDSDLRISASCAMSVINELDMEMGTKLEALGSRRAFDRVSLTGNTKALGIKTKSAADATGEYSIWTGNSDSELWSESIKGILIPGYEIEHFSETAPTCTEAGNKEYWMLTTEEGNTTYYSEPVISEANKHTYTYFVIPATGHLFSDEFTTDTEPTCTEDGSKSKHCTVCEESIIETKTAIPALGHEWDEGVVTKEATVAEEGEKTFTCSRCGDTRTEPIPKITPDPSGDDTKPTPTPSGDDAKPTPSPSDDETKPAPDSSDASVKTGTVTLNSRIVNAKTVKAALKKARGGGKAVTVLVLGKNVKKIKKGAFKNCRNVRTLVIKTKKLKKASVKNSLKGSRITKIRVRVSSKKSVNKKYVKKYRKLFTKKNAGRKVKVA